MHMRLNISSSTALSSRGIENRKIPRSPQGRRWPSPSRATAKWGGTSLLCDYSLSVVNEKVVRVVASTYPMAISIDVNRPSPSPQRRSTRDSSRTRFSSLFIICSSAITWTSSHSVKEVASPTRHLRTEEQFCSRTSRKRDGVYFPLTCETHTVCRLRSPSIGYNKVRKRSLDEAFVS
jgi:hypothetical protein